MGELGVHRGGQLGHSKLRDGADEFARNNSRGTAPRRISTKLAAIKTGISQLPYCSSSVITNPTAHGGNASDAFDVVIPSMPGYGYSGKPATTGWDPTHIARA